MSFLRFLIWTSASVAFGIFLGSADIGGKSPFEHLQRLWKQHAVADKVRDGLRDLWQEPKAPARPGGSPSEHYTSEDREAVNKIVARSGQK